MNISSGTVVLASAVLTLTTAAFGQQQQTAPSQPSMNFYVTTPQTGETVPVGATPKASPQQNVVVASAQAARSLNTYTDQTVSNHLNAAPAQTSSQPATRAPQAQTATRASQVQVTSARQPQSHPAPAQRPQAQTASAQNPASTHGYSIQQVANAPASSFQTARSSASSRAAQTQNARTAQRQVSTSAAQHPNFYSNTNARQAARNHTSGAQAAHAGSNAQKQSLLNRLTNRNQHQATTQQHQQRKPAAAQHDTVPAIKPSKLNGTRQTGIASWYGGKWHGRKTANGERYDQNSLTAAHKTLPFGTLVKVRNERNGREVIVRINNRGPFTRGRIIDLSKSAASKIGMVSSGITKVTCEVVGRS